MKDVWLPSVIKHGGAGVPLCGVEIFFWWGEAQRPRGGRRYAGAYVEEMVGWVMSRSVAETGDAARAEALERWWCGG